MSFHIESKKLILPLILLQGLDHMHEDDAGVKRTLNLETELVQALDRHGVSVWVPYVEIHPKMLTAEPVLFNRGATRLTLASSSQIGTHLAILTQ